MNDELLDQALEILANQTPLGARTVEYLQAHQVPIRFAKQNKATGARWTLGGAIEINPERFPHESTKPGDPALLSLLVHETRHLEQGFFTALSVFGELEAWQLGFNFYKSMTGDFPKPVLAEICSLPLNKDRTVLVEARRLMQVYATKGYRIDLLPLYPLPEEIIWRLTRIRRAGN